MSKLPVVAILGRPNVGKSPLFTRLVGDEKAIVENRPGVTRDRHYVDTDWDGHRFTLVDTGGFADGEVDALAKSVRRQAEKALKEAVVAILVVDGRAGVTPDDEALADAVRRSGKPVLVVANKMDDSKVEARSDLGNVYELGFPEVFGSAASATCWTRWWCGCQRLRRAKSRKPKTSRRMIPSKMNPRKPKRSGPCRASRSSAGRTRASPRC